MTTASNRAKGKRFETAVRSYLGQERKLRVIAPRVGRAQDQGDALVITPGGDIWCLEMKDSRESVDVLMREAIEEFANSQATAYAGVKKRRGKGVDQAYVIMPLWLFADLLEDT